MLAEIGEALWLIVGGDVEVWQIAGVSFAVSATAVIGAVGLGLPLTYILAASGARSTRIGLWVAHGLAALPTVVIGLTLYFVLSATGPLGWTTLLYTRAAMALAQFVIALPLVVVVVLGAGPSVGNVHKPNEHTRIPELFLARDLYRSVIEQLCIEEAACTS